MRPRLPHIIRKEFIQIRRDRRMAPIILIAPILQLFLLGYAATTDVNNIDAAVLDQDRTADSRFFTDRIRQAGRVSPPHWDSFSDNPGAIPVQPICQEHHRFCLR